MNEELYGQDILLDSAMQATIAANGEAVLSDGLESVLQDIKLRLFTPLGSLFYDVGFGSLIHEFVKDEDTEFNRHSLAAEVETRLNEEPRIVPESPYCEVLTWDPTGVTLRATFMLIDETHAFNLVLTISDDMEMVISDVRLE